MRCERLAVMAGIVAVCGVTSGLLAQNQAPPPAPPAPAQPAVAPAPGRDAGPSIIERTPEGYLKRLEIPAEERAIQVMDLEPAERARAEKVLAERAEMLDEIVLKNFDLLTKMHVATQAGNAEEARRVSGLFIPKLDRLADRGRLEDEVRPELRLDHQEEFTRIITRYRQALLQEAQREAKAEGKEIKAQTLADREIRRAMAREVQRSYDRLIVGTPVEYEKVLAGLGLSPEQESKARNLAAEFAQKRVQATAEMRRELLMQVLAGLDEGQRWKLIRAIRAG